MYTSDVIHLPLDSDLDVQTWTSKVKREVKVRVTWLFEVCGKRKKNVDLKVPSKLINITKPYIWTIWLSKYVYHGNAKFPVQWHDIPNRSPDITVDKLEKTVNVSISIVHSPGLNRTKELWIVMRINMSKMFQCSHLMLFFSATGRCFCPCYQGNMNVDE